MLVNGCAFVALLSVLAAAITGAAVSATRIALYMRAQTAVASGITRATATLVQTTAAQIAQSGTLDPQPAFTPLPPQCIDAACVLESSASIALASGSASVGAPNVETNEYVAERRVAARITVTISAGGVPLVTRTHDAILRETLAPPYASLAGVRDEDAGNTTTIVNVQYCNASSGACTDASSLSAGSYAPLAQPKGWSP